jgi:hypothetical protein
LPLKIFLNFWWVFLPLKIIFYYFWQPEKNPPKIMNFKNKIYYFRRFFAAENNKFSPKKIFLVDNRNHVLPQQLSQTHGIGRPAAR